MTFEAQVMEVVTDTVGTNETDGFFNGTLYVTCLPEEASQLIISLNKKFGPVEVTPQAGYMEYSFDFTA